jgi:hypothetical protein
MASSPYSRSYIQERLAILGDFTDTDDYETFGDSMMGGCGLFEPTPSDTKEHWIRADAFDADAYASNDIGSCGGEEECGYSWQSVRDDIMNQLTKLREKYEELFAAKQRQSKNGVKKHARRTVRKMK